MVLVLFALTSFAGVGFASSKAEQGDEQIHCPVMGGQIDRNVYVDYQGKRVYFCCPSCKAEFIKNPDEYLKKMEEEGVVPEKSPEGKQ